MKKNKENLIERKSKKGSRFYLQVTHRARQVQIPLGNNEASAKKRRTRFLLIMDADGFEAAKVHLAGGKPFKKGDSPTFEQMKELYAQYLATAKPLRPKTVYDNLAALKRIMTACGVTTIAGIDSQKVRQAMLPEKPTPSQERGFRSTISGAKSLFKKNALHFYQLQGRNIPNPLDHVETTAPKIDPYTPVPVTIREHIRQNPDFDPQENLILLLGIECGLRRSEIEACRLGWWSEQADCVLLSVQEAENFETKSGKKRNFPVDKDLFAEMIALRNAANPTDDFFVPVVSKTGINRLERRFKKVNAWLKQSGVRGVGTLRKEAGSTITANADIFETQRVLGHSSPTVTATHYAGILNLKIVGGKVKITAPETPEEALAKKLGITVEELNARLASV